MPFSSVFAYCPHCATALEPVVREGVERRRCPACGWVHYRNPTVGVAVVLVEDGQVLLGKRGSGRWCIPCGHVEFDETIEEAARREMHEETGLVVSLGTVCAVKSNFHDAEHQTVGVWFHGSRVNGTLRAGGDLTEVCFTPLSSPPSLEFPTDLEVIEQLRQD